MNIGHIADWNGLKTEKGSAEGMVNKVINEQQLKAICDVLGETNQGFTKTELTRLLQQCGIDLVSDGSKNRLFGDNCG